MLDGIHVMPTSTFITQMANVAVPEPRLITIKPWEKGQAKAIDKALRDSDLGINPQVDERGSSLSRTSR